MIRMINRKNEKTIEIVDELTEEVLMSITGPTKKCIDGKEAALRRAVASHDRNTLEDINAEARRSGPAHLPRPRTSTAPAGKAVAR